MKVLITGAGGQVGRALSGRLPPEVVVHAPRHTELDITRASDVDALIASVRPNWIINAAAYTSVDAAEQEAPAAFAVNDAGVGVLAIAASAAGARLLHLSTDFVFDGLASSPYEPDGRTAPLGAYGASKLAGEHKARSVAPSSIIVRTSWVYSSSGRNFVRTMLDLMGSRPRLRVVYDQVGSPTWASGLADAVWRLVLMDAPAGTYHWRDAGVTSWFDFAVAIQEEALERRLLTAAIPIDAIRSSNYPTPARRPAFSVLDIASTVALLGQEPEHWRVNLRKMLDELVST